MTKIVALTWEARTQIAFGNKIRRGIVDPKRDEESYVTLRSTEVRDVSLRGSASDEIRIL